MARRGPPGSDGAMSHAEFRATLTPAERARLTARSDGPGLRHLAAHLGAILVMGAALAAQVPFWWLLVVPQGIAIAFLFTLQHECTHRTPFASPRLNEWVGRGAGLLIGQPFLWFRYFHLAHHRHTHDPERDPELAGGGKPETWGDWLRHASGWTYWAGHAATLAAGLTGRLSADYLPAGAMGRIVREMRAMAAVYAGVAAVTLFVSPVLWRAWLLPVLVGMPALRLYVLAEHGRCAHVADLFENTRTTLTNRIVRGLAWNMPYHAEHHGHPDVPFHRLPELHAMARPHLGVVQPGYAAFTARWVRSLAQSM